MPVVQGHILTPSGFVAGTVELGTSAQADRIGVVRGEPATTEQAREAAGAIVLPGFIDLHVHGGGGADVMDGGDATAAVCAAHATHGTTALLATTMTAPLEDLENALRGIAPFTGTHRAGRAHPRGARVLGVHLEGPYLSPDKLGAQPPYARPLSLAELTHLDTLATLRMVTLAPEIEGHLAAIEQLAARNIVVQIGHSSACYEDAVQALSRGARSFTHLFNAMSPLHHRAPGVVGAALAHAEFAELIVDLLHLHPGAIRTALRAIPRAYCVTDSTAAAGMPDGDYHLGRQKVVKCGGGVRLADGTLAGSTLTMDDALRNLLGLGVDLADASRRTSTYAADCLGLTDRGRLAAGAFADAVVFDRDLRLRDVFVEGVPLS